MENRYFIRKPEVFQVSQLTSVNRQEVKDLISLSYPNLQDDGTTISYSNGFFGSSIVEGDYFRSNGNFARWDIEADNYSEIDGLDKRYTTENDN